jgi:hypothetical protein
MLTVGCMRASRPATAALRLDKSAETITVLIFSDNLIIQTLKIISTVQDNNMI